MQCSTGRSAFLLKFSLSVCLCFVAGLLRAGNPPQTEESIQPARTADEQTQVVIPGPLKPFLRMAAVSQQITPSEVLPLLARNVVIDGYRGSPEKDPKPTEFLILLKRYLQQAKELQALAGTHEVLSVTNCREADRLLAIIGYRLKQGCGPDSELEAGEPERAFVANDSGFPIAEL